MTKKEFMKLYKTHTVQELAIKFSVSRQTIYKYLKELDIQLIKRKRKRKINFTD